MPAGAGSHLATLHEHLLDPKSGVVDLAHAIASGINAWMNSKMGGEYDRRLALSKRTNGSPKHALNVIVHMDMPRAIQFRYFWLEILCSGQAAEAILALVDLPKVADLRDQARLGYIAYVASEKERALKTSAPGMSEGERKSYART